MEPKVALPMPMSHNPEYSRKNWPAYADMIRRGGGEPIMVDLNSSPAEIIECAGSCQGILLPGSGADVNAAKYGRPMDPSMAPPDGARENVDELLLQDAHNLYKPILGICFGAQMLNVWRSGSLVQDLSPLPVNHRAGASVAVAHTVELAGTGLLAELLTGAATDTLHEGRLTVNSSHHQAIERPGDGLVVSGWCPQDGVVEAVENGKRSDGSESPHFVLGVQWHPERASSSDAHARALFAGFIEAARAWRPRLVKTSVVDLSARL